MGSAEVGPPFSVFPHLKMTEERLENLLHRANNVMERLTGPSPANPEAAKSNTSNVQAVAEEINFRLSALENLIARIDNSI